MIKQLLDNGYSRAQLAMIYDVGVSTIYKHFPCNKLNIFIYFSMNLGAKMIGITNQLMGIDLLYRS